MYVKLFSSFICQPVFLQTTLRFVWDCIGNHLSFNQASNGFIKMTIGFFVAKRDGHFFF